MHPLRLLCALCGLCVFALSSVAAPFSTNANRLAYLDEDNPFYPHRDFPRLITPQWVGEPGVEAVVILAIDDMRESKKYETFLRPILDRLKRMDGRAPVSIFANIVTTNDTPQLEAWLKEGLSLEVHTLAHPCPLLQKGSFTNAWNTYHGGVDLLSKVPGNKPVAFRMPCCDSMNSPSPRFYAEIFNRTSPDGNFLQADSSVMCLLTDDFLKRNGASPRPQTFSSDHFRRYFPAQTNALTKKSLANFGTYIEDYPYPYVINRTCWEFPAMVPSDWEAFNAHGPTNAATVADWQLALDAVVRAQGVFTFIFHPHGWIRSDQLIQFIDHAERTHGKKVKFLTFKEAVERLNNNFVRGQLNNPSRKNVQLRVADIDNDGLMDVVVANNTPNQAWGFGNREPVDFTLTLRRTEMAGKAYERSFAKKLSSGKVTAYSASFRLAVMEPPFTATAFLESSIGPQGRYVSATRYGMDWEVDSTKSKSFPTELGGQPINLESPGVRFRDFDRDGRCELLVSNDKQNALFAWSETERTWKKLPYALPPGLALVNERGEDNGLRFVDLNGDGFDDLLLSNEKEYAIYLWARDVKPHLGWHAGWSHKVLHEQRNAGRADLPVGQNAPTTNDAKAAPQRGPTTSASLQPSTFNLQPSPKEIPPFVRSGPHRNNGAWFHRGQLFVQNEDTAHLPDVVWRKSFSELIAFDMPAPKTPAESQQCFQVRPGFRVELVAAEPLVMSPVAFEWGADGRLWVVEMSDYPNGVSEQEARASSPSPFVGRGERAGVRGGGRVKFLEDLDGDGRYDRATIFLDGLPFPTGVMPWRNGVLISSAPDILYAEDTDGDGKADVRKVLFTGFREGNQQHRVNGFELGLDNWIYGANGDSGGTITFVSTTASSPSPPPGERAGVRGQTPPSPIGSPTTSAAPPPHPQSLSPAGGEGSKSAPGSRTPNSKLETPNSKPVSISGRDFRFRPDTGEFEAIEGQTQFGRRRDDWGNWFGNNNPNWLWHYWLPDRYLRRNPHLAVKSSKQMLANYPDSTRCFPVSVPPIRFNQPQSVGHVTSGCSPAPYRDDLFGPGFATSVFISEPVHNLVHREVLEPDGVSFTSHRAPDEQDREFLASTDNWFRPTMLKTGPDGALYIADFYRFVLEHPEWIAPETQARLDLRAGADKGRIWRVVPENQPRRPIPNLAKLNTTQLVTALDSPSGWQRDTVQRLLVERHDKAAVEPLKTLLRNGEKPKPRLHALCALEGLEQITPEIVYEAAGSGHWAIGVQAVRIAEGLGAIVPATLKAEERSRNPKASEVQAAAILDILLTAYSPTQDPQISFQVALSSGAWKYEQAGLSLARLATEAALKGDRRTVTAALCSAPSHLKGVLAATFKSEAGPPPDSLAEQLIELAVSSGDRNAIAVAATNLVPIHVQPPLLPRRFSTLSAFLNALDRKQITLSSFIDKSEPDLKQALQSLGGVFSEARKQSVSPTTPPVTRQSAITLLGRGPSGRAEDLAILATLLKPQQAAEIQSAAVAQLAKLGGSDSASALLADWKAHSPALREAVLSALLSRPAWIDTLLAAIERGQVAPTQISPAQRQKLITHPQATLRDRATKLFAATSADRAKVIKDYAVVATLTGSETRGRELFTKNCGVCHKLKGEGREIGPDLAMTTTRDTDWLLTAILDPNAAVETRYLGYTAETKSGREFTGIITAETPNNLVLRGADGTEETILRTDLKQLLGSGLSLMPEGMESALKPQDMADLLAFIRAK